MDKPIDKVLHSAVGLGSIATILIAYLLWWLDLIVWIFLAPILLGVGKEIIDFFYHGKPSAKDIVATLNPCLVISWYLKQIKK